VKNYDESLVQSLSKVVERCNVNIKKRTWGMLSRRAGPSHAWNGTSVDQATLSIEPTFANLMPKGGDTAQKYSLKERKRTKKK
jgi:hypothetical protein